MRAAWTCRRIRAMYDQYHQYITMIGSIPVYQKTKDSFRRTCTVYTVHTRADGAPLIVAMPKL